MDEEVSPLEREHSLSVLLPGGLEKNATVHGSKPVMDLLVTLCASYHLNPSDYTVEVLSPNNDSISFKPNSPIGLLEAEKIVLKPKAGEEKIRTSYMPEATVRLLINYNKSHKAVVRVNPRVPLETLLPMVCNKCEFQVESTVLLRDSESKEGLDLSKTLNELGLREVYAKDTAAKKGTGYQQLFAASITPTKVSSSSSLQDLTKKEKKKSENKGFLSLFRKHRKKSEPTHAASAPCSPGPTKSRSASVSTQDAPVCTTPTADMAKKRRAPQPPMGAFHSFPTNLSSCSLPQPSGENTLRSTKRRAPPPPVANHCQEVHDDTDKDCLNPLEEERESVEHESVDPSPSSSAAPPPSPPAPLHKNPDPQRINIRGKDLSDARTALAKVLTSSLSTGTLVKRLKNTTLHNGTSCLSSTEPSSENAIEIKSVLNSNLPTENEFEDPANKTGLTTFKVVPSRRESDSEPVQDIPAEEETNAETEIAGQVIPEIERSVNGEDSPDHSGSSSPIPCPAEGETSSCPLQHDNHNEDEDTAETAKQDDVRPVDDLKEGIKSGQSHESVTNEGDLYLGEEEVVKESPTDLNACDSKSCDDKNEGVVQGDDNEIFPPPPPPVCFSEYLEEASVSGTTRGVTNGHVRSHSEPPQNVHSPEEAEKTGSAPSRFAQAVALAVQRSRLHSTGKTISALLPQET